MSTSEENNEYKLLILDRIKDPTRANAVMEVIANNRGDEALAAVIGEMETVDVARLFTEAFDYGKPNQAAGLIDPNIAEDCILAILARRSSSRIAENPRGPAQDIQDFITSVVLSRPIERQHEFKDLVEDYMELFTACLMADFGYHGEELCNIIRGGEQGTVAEIAKNLRLTDDLLKSLRGAMGKKRTKDGMEEEEDEDDFDAVSERRRVEFIRNTLTRFHRKAIEKFGVEATSSMEEFMDM